MSVVDTPRRAWSAWRDLAVVRQNKTAQFLTGVTVSLFTAVPLFLFLDRIAHRFPFFCFYPGIIAGAYLAGTPGGVGATLAAAALIFAHWGGWYDVQGFRLVRQNPVDPIELAAVGIFIGTGVAISIVQGRLRHTRNVLQRDIARRQIVEQALRESAKREAEANRTKDKFLANLSHELRTPLNVVLGYSRMLRARPCRQGCSAQDHVDRWLTVLERNAIAQMRLIEDLLDVQRIVSGRLTIERGRCDISELTRAVLESLRPVGEAKGLHVGVTAESVIIEGDAARIQQVIWNLLSNAIKFTPANGCVGLHIGKQEDQAVIRVEDSGEGIPPHFLPHVFEPFRQLDESSTRRHFGMGLGLSIVKHVVDLHGGTITADSAGEGLGATFTVMLPLTQQPEPTAEQRPAEG